MNVPNAPAAEWIEAALAEYEGPLIRYALRFTRDPDQARDIVQDAFLQLCRADPADVADHVGAWLFTVCRNRALDILRKEDRMNVLSEAAAEVVAGPDPGPEARAEHRDDHRRALAALGALSPNQQEIVRLKFQAGLSYNEISAITGLSVSNVGFQIHTAIRRLRAGLADAPTGAPRRVS
jgi:RNA polymerase sigma factor (sigma-70 family)